MSIAEHTLTTDCLKIHTSILERPDGGYLCGAIEELDVGDLRTCVAGAVGHAPQLNDLEAPAL
jgi:hypothetical protein